MSTPTKLDGKQIKDGSINLIALYSSLGLGALDDGKALVYTHTPTPTVNFQKVKFTKIEGVPNALTAARALVINNTLDGLDLVTIVKSFNGSSGDIIFNSTDLLPEGATNKYFSGKTADDLPEGATNLYFNGKTTSDLLEGTNLYWTNARFDTRFGTSWDAKKLQDVSNVNITGIIQDDLIKYDLLNDEFVPFTPSASNIVLDPTIDDGGAIRSNVQDILDILTIRNKVYSHTLLTLTLTTYTSEGLYIIVDDDFTADSLIVSFDKTTGFFFITTPIAGTIFNNTNTPANGKVNIYVTGAPGAYQLKIDNQTLITKKIKVRGLI